MKWFSQQRFENFPFNVDHAYFFYFQSNKYAESISLFGLISAVFNASYAIGEGFGPMIGGLLIDMYKFEVIFNAK